MRLPAVEERREETLEMAIHRLERREQPRAALAIEAADRTAEAVDRLRQFLDLGGASLTLGIEFDEFVGGDEIDRAEPLAVGDQPVVLRRFGIGVADARALEPRLLREQRRRTFETFARQTAHFDAAEFGIFGARHGARAGFASGGDAFADPLPPGFGSSEERRVGTGCVPTCTSRWSRSQ